MASGTRGYSSYRGRGRKGKIFLAILLICIILGSVGFIMAREHMRYDADGNLHFDLPWDKGTSDPVEAPGDPDVVIREPEQTTVKTPVRGTLLAAKPLTMEDQETAETPLSEAAVTAVTLKDSAGRVYFDSSAAVTGAVSVKPDTGEALNDLTARTDVTAAARIACFHDPKAANADVEGMGLNVSAEYHPGSCGAGVPRDHFDGCQLSHRRQAGQDRLFQRHDRREHGRGGTAGTDRGLPPGGAGCTAEECDPFTGAACGDRSRRDEQ